VEIFERRYPALIDRFAIRRNTGGPGLHFGGNGIERAIRFLCPVKVCFLVIIIFGSSALLRFVFLLLLYSVSLPC